MVDFTQNFLLLPSYSVFLGGVVLLVLGSLLSIVPPAIREKLKLKWLIPAVFATGMARILIAFSAIEPHDFYFLLEALLRILSMLFIAEYIRSNWPAGEDRPSAFLHIPFAVFFVILYVIAGEETSPLLKTIFGIMKLAACFTGLRAALDLAPEIRTLTRTAFWLGTIGVIMQTAMHLAINSKLAIAFETEGREAALVMSYFEIALIFLICINILIGRFMHDRTQKLQSQSAFSLFSPAVIVLITIFLSIAGLRLSHHVALQQQQQTASSLQGTILGLTQLINQRIHFASTSSGIMAASPIMAQYLDNPDSENTRLLNVFLRLFTRNNPGTICYIMDSTGLVHAASDLENLFLGKNLGFRNYFQIAMQGMQGNLIDYGVLTSTLGFYSSHPIRRASDNKILGVCAVKRNLDDLEELLRNYHPAMLLDGSGTTFLASDRRLAGIKLGLNKVKYRNPQPMIKMKNHALLDLGSSEFTYATMAIENQNWQLLMLVPSDKVFNQRWVLIIILLVVFVFVAILTGITRNAESIKSFEIAQSQFKLVFDNAPESIFVVSLKSLKVLEANQSMLRQFNIAQPSAGINYFDLMPVKNRSISNAWHDSARKFFKHERDFRKQTGEIFSAEVTGSIIHFNGEKALLLILHDISMHREVEEKLREAKNAAEEANALKARFFANASHEIRTPMTAIIGLSELAATMCSNDEQKHLMDLIRTSGKSMLNLLNDILDLAQIEVGRLKINPVQFNLHLLLKDLIEIIRFQAEKDSVKTTLILSRDLPEMVISDPDRMRQMLLNLLTNAVKFTHRGEIRLSASYFVPEEGLPQVEFTVADTRTGISAEIQRNLFGAFVYSDPYIKDEGRNIGLGLSISKQIIDLLGGKIKVEAEPGDGTTFKISIPVKPGDGQPPVDIREEVFRTRLIKNGRPLHFLIADDNEINLFLASSIIEKFKGTFVCVKDGIEALAALKTGQFDAILLDIQMPRLDGIATLKAIREQGEPVAGIPVIAISAFASDQERSMARDAGAHYYLAKPYFPEDLLLAIRKVLELDNSDCEPAGITVENHEKSEARDSNPTRDFSALVRINRQELELRILKKPENVLQIREIFSRRSQALELELDACLRDRKAEQLREVAHSIKGLVGMLAAGATFELARKIEFFSRDGEFEQAAELVPELKKQLHEIADDLDILKCEAEKKIV